jgi:hypothetical protein
MARLLISDEQAPSDGLTTDMQAPACLSAAPIFARVWWRSPISQRHHAGTISLSYKGGSRPAPFHDLKVDAITASVCQIRRVQLDELPSREDKHSHASYSEPSHVVDRNVSLECQIWLGS